MSRPLPSILITGGLGFIGKNLAIYLLKKNYSVTILDFRAANLTEKKSLKGAKFVTGDVTHPQTWATLPKADVICHFAAPSSIMAFKQNLADAVSITLKGLINAFNWAQAHQCQKLIYPSSGSIFGGGETPCSEITPANPPNSYGLTKLACEAIAKIYTPELPSLGLRIFAGFGPGEFQKGNIASVITLFLAEMKAGRPPIIYGDGSQTRDFIYIDDVVETIATTIDSNLTGVLNVGSGKAVSFNQVVDELNLLLKTNIKPVYVARPTSYLESTLCQPNRLIKILGHRPLNFHKGLRQYFKVLAATANKNQV